MPDVRRASGIVIAEVTVSLHTLSRSALRADGTRRIDRTHRRCFSRPSLPGLTGGHVLTQRRSSTVASIRALARLWRLRRSHTGTRPSSRSCRSSLARRAVAHPVGPAYRLRGTPRIGARTPRVSARLPRRLRRSPLIAHLLVRRSSLHGHRAGHSLSRHGRGRVLLRSPRHSPRVPSHRLIGASGAAPNPGMQRTRYARR